MYVSLKSAVDLLDCLRKAEHSDHPHASSIGRARKELSDVMCEPDPVKREERKRILFMRWQRRGCGTGRTAKTKAEKGCWRGLHGYAEHILMPIPKAEMGVVRLRNDQYVVEYYSENNYGNA